MYLEGSTDLSILQSFARKLKHPVGEALQTPFVYYVLNQPKKAQDHYYGLKEGVPKLRGFGLFDNLGRDLPEDKNIKLISWKKREIENYFALPKVLLRWAEDKGQKELGDLYGSTWGDAMKTAIQETSNALATLGKPLPDSNEIIDVLDQIHSVAAE